MAPDETDLRETRSPAGTPAAADIPAGVVEDAAQALDLIVNVAGLYSLGHQRFLEAVQRFRPLLQVLSGPVGSFALKVLPDGLQIQSVRVRDDCAPAAHLHEILDLLGIVRVWIAPSVRDADLHEFSARIQRALHEARDASEFRQLEFDGLPPTVRVQVREFGRPQPPRTPGRLTRELVEGTLSRSADALEKMDLGRERQDECRALLDEVLGELREAVRAEEAFSASLPRPDPGGSASNRTVSPPAREWRSEEEEEALDRLLLTAERALTGARDGAVADLLRNLLRRAGEEADPSGGSPPELLLRAHAPDHTLSCDELKDRISEYASRGRPLAELGAENRGEQLSVLLQVLLCYPTPRVLGGVRKALQSCLSGALPAPERQILLSAAGELIAKEDAGLLDRSLPLVLGPLRASEEETAARFLAKLLEDATPEVRAALGPHVANEILSGLDDDHPEIARRLEAAVADPGEETARDWARRISRLSAVRETAFAKRIFQPPLPALRPLFAAVLADQPDSLICSLLLEGFRERPPDLPEAAALEVLADDDPGVHDYLIELLRHPGGAHPGEALRREAGRILLAHLPDLPRNRRAEGWVPRAVQALARSDHADAPRALGRIRGRRRLLFLHAWPSVSRRAARHAASEDRE